MSVPLLFQLRPANSDLACTILDVFADLTISSGLDFSRTDDEPSWVYRNNPDHWSSSVIESAFGLIAVFLAHCHNSDHYQYKHNIMEDKPIWVDLFSSVICAVPC